MREEMNLPELCPVCERPIDSHQSNYCLEALIEENAKLKKDINDTLALMSELKKSSEDEGNALVEGVIDFSEQLEKRDKGYDICWVIECHFMRGNSEVLEYFTGDTDDNWNDRGSAWNVHWDRALKMFDRASCEVLAKEMNMDWDIRIRDHQVMHPIPLKGTGE